MTTPKTGPSPTTASISAQRPWRTAGVAGMASYLDAGVLFTTGTALVLYQDSLGITPDDIGGIAGVLAIMFAVGSLLGGPLGDRFGRRRVFTVTLFLYIVGVALSAFAINVEMLFAAAIITGVAIGADLPVSLALVNEEAPVGKKGRMVALTSLLWFGGIVATTVLSAIFAPLGGLAARLLFGHLLVAAIIVVFLRLTIRESQEWTAARNAVSEGAEQIQFRRISQVFKVPVLWPTLALGLYVTLWALTTNAMSNFGTFFFTTLAGTDVQTAALISLAGLAIGVTGAIVFIRIADTRARFTFFVIGTLLGVVGGLAPLVFGPSLVTLAVFAILSPAGAAFSGEAIYKLWSQEYVPTLLRSTVQGLGLSVSRIVTALAAFVIPSLAITNHTLLFGALAAATIAAAVIGLAWVPRLRTATQLEVVPIIVGAETDSAATPVAAETEPGTPGVRLS